MTTTLLWKMLYVQMHVKSVHEGMKPFKCVICDAKFVQKAGLDKHNYNFTRAWSNNKSAATV